MPRSKQASKPGGSLPSAEAPTSPSTQPASKERDPDFRVLDLTTAEGREEFEGLHGAKEEEPETKRDEFAPKQGVFEFVVLSHTMSVLPGEKGYDPERDRLMIGFRYGNQNPPPWMPYGTKKHEVTAYDFLTNPRTGMREGQKMPPHGTSTTYLRSGVTSWSDLPPLAIWKSGIWLSQIVFRDEFDIEDLPSLIKKDVKEAMSNWPKKGVPSDIYNIYVTSGEGTTGNNLYRIYELPEEACGRDDPHHPLMWPERLKKPTGTYYGDQNAYKGESWRPETEEKKTTTTTTTPATKSFTPPAGVRMRCPECGHWYSYSDLIVHSGICGDPEKADWAIMCHGDCGCMNLDQASAPKPGFPRPKKEAEPVDTGGTSEDSPVSPGDAGGAEAKAE